MEFKKYQHVERVGKDSTDGLLDGICIIQYKIDGTNSSVWLNDEGQIRAGSRNRELTFENDNAGFYKYISEYEPIQKYLKKHPNHRLYGEWLVPHSLKTYREEAWRKFYVFDVCLDKEDGSVEYLPYDMYKEFLDEFDIDYIPPLAIIKNPNYESLLKCIDKTGQFLVEDGKGQGEGIVVKNYDYHNQYGEQVWGKIVRNDFKEKHHKEMGAPEINNSKLDEEKIIEKYVTPAFIEKEYAKIVNEEGIWKSKFIPKLFERVYRELIIEEMYNIVKEFKNPKINFKTLHSLIIREIKSVKKELFS
ncbi:MAG TPA: hypothetical protein DHM42_09850 [Clostridiales bacterium]|nr:hypothetical protein [Clostridiales bacterium]